MSPAVEQQPLPGNEVLVQVASRHDIDRFVDSVLLEGLDSLCFLNSICSFFLHDLNFLIGKVHSLHGNILIDNNFFLVLSPQMHLLLMSPLLKQSRTSLEPVLAPVVREPLEDLDPLSQNMCPVSPTFEGFNQLLIANSTNIVAYSSLAPLGHVLFELLQLNLCDL